MCHLKTAVALSILLAGSGAWAQSDEPPFIAVDEKLWVTFYDVPSHRFRATLDSFVRRDFASASHDLETSANYLRIEAGRAQPAIGERLLDVANQMSSVATDIEAQSVTVATLDQLFGRSHWLLAQHYLGFARDARDADRNRMAGKYLWATTHHLERAVLWSNSRIERKIVKTLDDLRDLAMRLQDSDKALSARKQKPIVKAEKVLVELGEKIDRPVVLRVSD